MPGIVRLSDLWSGHCYEPRASSQSSEDVYANEEKCVRDGDSRYSHSCGSLSHDGTNTGNHDVYINNKSAQAKDDPVSCGSTQAMASDDVFVNWLNDWR